MKKYGYFIGIFIFIFAFFFTSRVSGKSVNYDGVEISFGEENEFYFYYQSINEFPIDTNDNSFYYDGKEYIFNGDFSYVNSIEIVDNKFSIGSDVLTLDKENNKVISNKIHYVYNFPVFLEVSNPSDTYEFAQELCYKYNNVEECNQDIGDISKIEEDDVFLFYYSFLPFYNKNIVFDYLEYRFTLISESETVNLTPIRFEKEEIIYHEYFKVGGYNNIITYEDKAYIIPISNSLDNGQTEIVVYLAPHGYTGNVTREYRASFYYCVGENYEDCYNVLLFDSEKNENVDSFLTPHDKGYLYVLNLKEIVYDKNQMKANYDSFKLKASYVCEKNCDSSMASQKELTYTNEEIYYFNFEDAKFVGEINGKEGSCGLYTCYGTNKEITNILKFKDDNGIKGVYYYFSDKRINNIELINGLVGSSGEVVLNPDNEGYYYLYYKVIDGIGNVITNINKPYMYLFDKTGPILSDDNFDDFNEVIYNSLNLTVKYSDEYTGGATKIYYLVVNEFDSVSLDEVLNGYVYSNGVILDKSTINNDGKYKACFVSEDILGNYSEITCSKAYSLDVTGLVKEEVRVSSGNEEYSKSVNIEIDIAGVSQDIEFLCDLVSVDYIITEYDSLTKTCKNKANNTLSVNGEGEYNLWIYAPDYINNYGLVKIDNVYLLDTLAPRVYYDIIGDNKVYSNNVTLDIVTQETNMINSLSYEFYLKTYNEKQFLELDNSEDIIYPFNYYGEYKVAIKACDELNNCSINTFDDTFLIDTSIISIELIGKEEVNLLKWSKYKEEGAKASKGNGGKSPVSVSYQIEGSIDTNSVGVYYLTYTSGEGMNKVSVTRKVVIKDNSIYLVSFTSLFVLAEVIILLRLFVKKRKNDSI